MYTTAEAAAQVGVSKNTLLRWISEGRLRDVERDWRNWRVWRDDDVARAQSVREALHERDRAVDRPVRKVRQMPRIAADMSRLAEGRKYRAQ